MRAITTSYQRYPIALFAGFALVLGIFGLALSHSGRVNADSVSPGEHIITVHDDGVDKGFMTKESTLREALKVEGIRLDEKDRTEPGLDEKLVSNSYQVNIYHARPVVIRDGATETRVVTSYRTVRQIAEEAKITLHDADKVTLEPTRDPLADGAAEVMVIVRATPVSFVFYGKQEQTYTMATTVSGMLAEKGINMQPADGISPTLATAITPNMTVKLWRNGVQTVTQDEAVPHETQQVKDADRPVGYSEVRTPGEDGKRTVTYEINMQNGIEVSRKEINSVTTKQATARVEVVGTKVELPAGSHEDWMAAAGIAASDYGYVNYIVNRESGWTPVKSNYAGSGAYGLCQALPASKMASAGGDYMTNPITQLRWCNGYAVGRYGSWAAAYNFWVSNHWW